jgi:hypothetical protein
MPVLEFSPRFVPLIISGQKRQTVRRTLKCAPGDALQLMEADTTRRLVDPDPICTAVHGVKFASTGIFMDGEPINPSTHTYFARASGFTDLHEMLDWYFVLYGRGDFVGFLTKW